MFKIKQIFLIFVLLINNVVFSQSFIDNTKGWISLSSLWGQGGMGLSYRATNCIYALSTFYNYSWDNSEFLYKEFELLRRHENIFGGIRVRYQYKDYELSPFIGRHDYFGLKKGYLIPFSIHNEAEWRQSPYNNDSYLRSQHGFTMFSPKKFFEEAQFTPFIGIVSYMNCEDIEIEKSRSYIGYSFNIEKYKFSLYYIIWRNGKTEEEWDDQNNFGASVRYIF